MGKHIKNATNKFINKLPDENIVLDMKKALKHDKKKDHDVNFNSFNGDTVIASASYEQAVARCKSKVEKIAQYCRKNNIRYRDAYFDLKEQPLFAVKEFGWKGELDEDDNITSSPASFDLIDVRRVHEIFENPKFFIDGCDAADVMQGSAGTCYFLAAVASLANMSNLIERICVARDETVGVYGFIFFRDGEWTSVVVDDQLATSFPEFHSTFLKNVMTKKAYDEKIAKGSRALYFTACKDLNETWMPLLEKAYAKIHGSYGAVDGGWGGEAIEDLTGGVTTSLWLRDILDTDKFWKTELLKANTDRIFSVGLLSAGKSDTNLTDSELVYGHAYSILKAIEIDGIRLILLRNPWGKTEWKGKWGDGSSEWTSEWLKKLNHKFGDDGQFWMEYSDFLREWTVCDRTRLFGNDWMVTSRWLNVTGTIPATNKLAIFEIEFAKETPAVIVLSQLDMRYFTGIEGCYRFKLSMKIVQIPDEKDVVGKDVSFESANAWRVSQRSINIELPQLKPGKYRIFVKYEMFKISLVTREEQITGCGEIWLPKLETLLKGFTIKKAKIAIDIAEYEDDEDQWTDEGTDQSVPQTEETGTGTENDVVNTTENVEEPDDTPEGDNEEAEDSDEHDEELSIRLTIYSKDPNVVITSAAENIFSEIAELDIGGVALTPDYDDPFADDLEDSSLNILEFVAERSQRKLGQAAAAAYA
ncbi:hypothetical protein HK096_009122 [Nowakowskiella sp. JEL0078]|nr:hypothetical protein HK096_009122 [Nowakowskiella sp. JEL0078]